MKKILVKIICMLLIISSLTTVEATQKKTYPLETKKGFVQIAIEEALTLSKEYGVPPSAIVAQAIYESNLGRSSLAKECNNFFGLKANSQWNGPTKGYNAQSDGYSRYRVYKNMKDGFRGYIEFIKQPRYKSAFKHKYNGEKFISCLLSAGYCPDSNYMSDITTIMNRYNLRKYDKIPLELSPIEKVIEWHYTANIDQKRLLADTKVKRNNKI